MCNIHVDLLLVHGVGILMMKIDCTSWWGKMHGVTGGNRVFGLLTNMILDAHLDIALIP